MNCAGRAKGISELTSFIPQLEATATTLQSDQQTITDQLNQVSQASDAIVYLGSILPKLSQTPFYGDLLAAQWLGIYTTVPQSLSTVKVALQKQQAVVANNIKVIAAAINGWESNCNKLKGFQTVQTHREVTRKRAKAAVMIVLLLLVVVARLAALMFKPRSIIARAPAIQSKIPTALFDAATRQATLRIRKRMAALCQKSSHSAASKTVCSPHERSDMRGYDGEADPGFRFAQAALAYFRVPVGAFFCFFARL